MAFTNLYKPATANKALLSNLQEDPYDINYAFSLPIPFENENVQLVPFVPSRHAQLFFNGTKGHDLFRKMPFFMTTLDEFLGLVEWIRGDPNSVLMLIIDKTRVDSTNHNFGGSMAGIIGLVGSSKSNLSTEIGPVVILPSFQRTHVCSNAIGLMLHYCFDLPDAGGLGFRRVQWNTNPTNPASIKVADKMGFIYEGTMRWMWVLPQGKDGRKVRDGDPVTGPGRDSVLLAVCWDDWEGGVRDRVDKVMKKV